MRPLAASLLALELGLPGLASCSAILGYDDTSGGAGGTTTTTTQHGGSGGTGGTTTTSIGGTGTGGGGSGGGVAGAGGASLNDVACDGVPPCVLPEFLCCVALAVDGGSEGAACQPEESLCGDTGDVPIQCDGPEDCPGGGVCCYLPWEPQGATCDAACQTGSAMMCHGDNSCFEGESCCPIPSLGGAYRTCSATPCPS